MKVYLVRHGESEFNALSRHQLEITELSKKGHEQARFLAERFHNVVVDLIMSSPYRRTWQTAEIISRKIKIPIESVPLLREAKRPSIIEGRYANEPGVIAIKTLIRDHFHVQNWRHSDEETFFELRHRATEFVQYLERCTEQNVLAVTHAAFMRMLMGVMLFGPELEPDVFLKLLSFLTVSNTGLSAFEKNPGDDWRLITWNDYAHLGD